MSKVKIHSGDGCWEWLGATGGSGYGQFHDGVRSIPAHWFLMPVRPEKGQEACHKCDNKLCVRPDHLFVGTRSDNMRDCVRKGRLRPENGWRAMIKVRRQHGQRNHAVKLTDDQAMIAKACPRIRGAATAMARSFGVTLTVISDIRDGKRWTHLPEPDATARQRAEAFLRTLNLWSDPSQ